MEGNFEAFEDEQLRADEFNEDEEGVEGGKRKGSDDDALSLDEELERQSRELLQNLKDDIDTRDDGLDE